MTSGPTIRLTMPVYYTHMKLSAILILTATVLSCDPPTPPNGQKECSEFPYKTTHAGKPVTCQLLWCTRGNIGDSHLGSGMSTLWCE
jgi:hypothetical protein